MIIDVQANDRVEYKYNGRVEFGTVKEIRGENILVCHDGFIETTWIKEEAVIEVIF